MITNNVAMQHLFNAPLEETCDGAEGVSPPADELALIEFHPVADIAPIEDEAGLLNSSR